MMTTTTTTTTTGLGVLAGDADLARRVTEGKPATILAHAASVLPDLTHAVDALYNPPSASGGGGGGGEARRALKGGRKGKWKGRSGVNLVSVLAPEHGFRGDKQAGHGGGNSTVDPRTGLTVFSIYNKAPKDIVDVVVGKSGAKVVLVDLQDSGARFYTYIWTLYDLLVAAAITNSSGAGVKVVVLDRPNPLGGVDPQGPVLDAEGGAFVSGVGKRPTPMKHAMTMGELAVLFNEEYVPLEKETGGKKARLEVVQMRSWTRSMGFTDTGLPWVAPSPNLPTLESVALYVGTGLVEGVNLSEGRGTTLPFQLLGAPYVGWEYADALRKINTEPLGVVFREAYFTPTMSKYANQTAGGIQVMAAARSSRSSRSERQLDSVRAAILIIKTAYDMYGGSNFKWVKSGSRYWIDLLSGNTQLREGIEKGMSVDEIVAQWQQELDWFMAMSQKYLMYGD